MHGAFSPPDHKSQHPRFQFLLHCRGLKNNVGPSLIIYRPNNETVEGSLNNSFPYRSLDS